MEEKMARTGRQKRMRQGTTKLFECRSSRPGEYCVIRRPLERDETEDDATEHMSDELEQMALMGLPLQFGAAPLQGKSGGVHVPKHRQESTGLHDFSAHESCPTSHIRFEDDVDPILVGAPRLLDSHTGSLDTEVELESPDITVGNISKGKKNLKLQKYWLQRYSLFSLFDQGIMIDEEGWYSATPEIIAWHHASMVVRAYGPGCVVLDAFGGVGGNAIQLALSGCRVIVTEMCPQRASIIKNNARVYGVEDDVEVLCGDVTVCGPLLTGVEVVLLSPPWGGPEYTKNSIFDVQYMGGHTDLSFSILLELVFKSMESSSALFWLPRQSDQEQIGIQVLKILGNHHECHIELSKINTRQKAVTVYVGALGDFVSKFNSVD